MPAHGARTSSSRICMSGSLRLPRLPPPPTALAAAALAAAAVAAAAAPVAPAAASSSSVRLPRLVAVAAALVAVVAPVACRSFARSLLAVVCRLPLPPVLVAVRVVPVGVAGRGCRRPGCRRGHRGCRSCCPGRGRRRGCRSRRRSSPLSRVLASLPGSRCGCRRCGCRCGHCARSSAVVWPAACVLRLRSSACPGACRPASVRPAPRRARSRGRRSARRAGLLRRRSGRRSGRP